MGAPTDCDLSCVIDTLLGRDTASAESSTMVNYLIPLPSFIAPDESGDENADEGEGDSDGDSEAEPAEDPNAHVDRGGQDGASVSVVGGGQEREVTVRGENGGSGVGTAVAQEVENVAGDFVAPLAADALPAPFSQFD